MNVSAVYSDGPVVDLDFTPTTDNLGLGAMGTPSEFDRRKKKKWVGFYYVFYIFLLHSFLF